MILNRSCPRNWNTSPNLRRRPPPEGTQTTWGRAPPAHVVLPDDGPGPGGPGGQRELNETRQIHNIIEHVVIGAMGPTGPRRYSRPGVLLIVPADRDDIIKAAGEYLKGGGKLAGIALSDDIAPSGAVLKLARGLPCRPGHPTRQLHGRQPRARSHRQDSPPGDTEKIDWSRI